MTGAPQAAGCGGCTLCCKVMVIPDLTPEPKPANEWCRHCDIGRGCSIYADRPQTCRDYACVWLASQGTAQEMPPDLRPDRCRVVINGLTDRPGLALMVDPGRPDAWKAPRVAGLVDKVRRGGLPVIVVVGERRTLLPGNPAPAGEAPAWVMGADCEGAK